MLRNVPIYYGSDPEGFFTHGGSVIGAEKVLPKGGIGQSWGSRVVLDGVQFELNPVSAPTLMGLAMQLSISFDHLKNHLTTKENIQVCFDGVVEVSREELDSLSDSSRILGCQPSRNCYGDKPITVDPKTYRKRSAGGHIHLGLAGTDLYRKGVDERQFVVPHLDIFVGNMCVLLDRDPGAAERRENYGRAGEFRLPTHGLEYRTLSNFWLKNYSLMHLAFGMANFAISIIDNTVRGGTIEQELIDMVDLAKFSKAIDTNDWFLAMENFNTIRPFLVKHLPEYSEFPLTAKNLDKFVLFAEGVKQYGLDAYFPVDPISHWVRRQFRSFNEFVETFK